MDFISCAKWIKKGVAKSNPEKVQLTQEELQKVINSTREKIRELEDKDDASMEEDGEIAGSSTTDRYNFADYDKEDASGGHYNIGNLVVENDEYKVEDDHDSEEEDDIIKPTDNLIAVGHIDGEASVLEIHLYNEQDNDLYVHHDILLPDIPLCLEWLSYDPTDSNPGNLLAVGSMSSVIAVWDLDIIDCLEPAYLLGKHSVKKKHNKSHGHKDAVLDIAWNKNYKHILASGSVDKTVLLWDLDEGKASTTFNEFTDKVQSIKWRPNDYHLLLAGSADKTAKLMDCRMTEVKEKWNFEEEIEKVAWCPWDTNKIYFGTSKGTMIHCDIRQPKDVLWLLSGHEDEITGLELDENCPNILVTCSLDQTVKIWDIENIPPKLKSTKSFGMNELQCLDLNPDCPYVACIGGTTHNFKVVNLKRTMLTPVPKVTVNTNPVTFGTSSTNMQLTEKALQSLSIKGKTFKSKKKFGHKFKKSR